MLNRHNNIIIEEAPVIFCKGYGASSLFIRDQDRSVIECHLAT